MSTMVAVEPTGRSTYRIVSVIQWALPLCLFAIATTYELLEHFLVERIFSGLALPSGFFFSGEVIFFGVIGPLSVAAVLGYLRRLLRAQMEAQRKVEEINRGLEVTVAERTRHLEEARQDLQHNIEALAHANAELRQLDRMKSDFVALVSHSLRAPLTNLNGALELIAQDMHNLPQRVQDTFRVLAEEGLRLQHLVQTILDVSRLEGGRLKLNLGPVALEPLLARVVDTVHTAQPERRVSLEVPRGVPPAWADEVYVEEVVRNLVSNAAKYSPEGSPVHVAVQLAGDALQISVADHGPGVPQDEQAQIFQAFQRSEVGERRDTSGLGLGLYFASKLVQAQGGRIWAESPAWPDALAPGARFVFTLPVVGEVPEMDEVAP